MFLDSLITEPGVFPRSPYFPEAFIPVGDQIIVLTSHHRIALNETVES